MRRFIISLLSIATMAAAFSSCSDDKLIVPPDEGSTVVPPVEVDPEATLKFSKTSIAIGGTENNFNELTVESNQRVFTATISQDAQEWLSIDFEGVIMRATALSSNKSGSVLSTTVTVVAGTGDNTASQQIEITQDMWDGTEEDATLTISPTTVTLDSDVSSSSTVTLTSNKNTFTATVQDGADWLSASIQGTTLTVTTLSKNETDDQRTCTVTIVAGETKTATQILTVNQKKATLLPTGVEIGALYQGGVVTYVDASVVKVVSLMASDKISWCIAGAESAIGIPNTNNDGYGNTELIKATAGFPDNFPAANFCVSMGQGWFLPSRDEYKEVTTNYVTINTYIEQYEGGMPLTADYIWSSNEDTKDPAGKAFAFRLTDKSAAGYAKSGLRAVRCMKNIPVVN